MAMTESPAQQQQYIQEAVTVAGSSSTAPAGLDEVRKGSFQKIEASTASSTASTSGNTAPTPPSSPPQTVDIEPLIVSRTSPQDQADMSSASAIPTAPTQQPTPPSTLPEDTAAFPLAVTEQAIEDEDQVERTEPTTSSTVTNVQELYITDFHEPPIMQPQSRSRSVSPVSSNSSASSILDDGVPTLDVNEASFLLENDSLSRNTTDTAYHPPRPSGAQQQPVTASRLEERLPQIPSQSDLTTPSVPTTRRRSPQSELPELPRESLYQELPSNEYLPLDQPQHPHRHSSLFATQDSSALRPQVRIPRRTEAQNTLLSRPERRRQSSRDFALPAWQPDSDVNNCPICSTGFSFFYRKHHCRKCGRVVCAPCSPHRIVIPKSFVVHPPNALDIDPATLGSGDGGLEVRICNTCLAGDNPFGRAQNMDPNGRRQSITSPAGGAGRFWQEAGSLSGGGSGTNYPQQAGSHYPGNTGSARRRTVSNVHPFTQAPGQHHQYPGNQHYGQAASFGDRPAQGYGHFNQHPPYHSHPYSQLQNSAAPPPLQHPTPSYPQFQSGQQDFSFAPAQFYPSPQPFTYHHQQHQGHQRSVSSGSAQTYSQYSPVNQPIRGHLDTSQSGIPAFSMPDSRPRLPIASQFMQNRELQTHSAPPQPRLKETDYCPICQSILPPVDPITNDETIREAHIQQCIESTMSSNDGNRRISMPSSPTGIAASPLVASRNSQPSTPQIGTSAEPQRPRRNTGANRMVVYTATEKDTYALGNDARADDQKAECVICFEEFETGDVIARLECFCRYHKHCIQDWFGRKDNATCPIHAMNE